MILCEKPLAMNAAEGAKMVEAVEKAGVPNMVWYNYRRIPAVTLAKKLIDEGRLGKIFHYRAKFLQDWTIKRRPAAGRAGPVAARRGRGRQRRHRATCSPTASTPRIWLNGRIDSVCAMTETFVKERKHNLTGKVEKVGIDDACIFMGTFANGSLANFESHPLRPRPQGAVHVRDQRRERVARLGPARPAPAAVLRLQGRGQDPRLEVDPRDRQRPDHPYMGNWWVPGLAIGYDASFTHQVADFIEGLETGKPARPDFRDALETQRVLDAILDSAKSQKWVTVARV